MIPIRAIRLLQVVPQVRMGKLSAVQRATATLGRRAQGAEIAS